MDVTNPGLVNVADEVEGNPDPNGGTVQKVPEDDDSLVAAAAQGYPSAPVDAEVFPTPGNVEIQGVVPLYPSGATYPPKAAEIDVAKQSLTGVSTPEFIVAGPTISIQTNRTEDTSTTFRVLAVLDADHLPAPAGPATTRYYLVVVVPPLLTSFGVSLQGRQVTFADDTLTAADQGATRLITGYGGNFVAINRDDQTPDNGGVPQLALPQVGDTFAVQTYREGSEDVDTTGPAAAEVVIAPPPPAPIYAQAPPRFDRGNVDVSTGPQPGSPIITSGTPAPASITVNIADQDAVVGLPTNVFV
jgi:hypothetical protein